jgi:pimeloyl-ACP methyl ester carboxylesterase
MTLLWVSLAILVLILGLVAFTAFTARRVEKALPPRGEFLDLNGARIHYLDKGAGPAIVLVHGLGGQMGNFAYGVVEQLTNEFRVLVIDRPGSGYSTRANDDAAHLAVQAAFVAEFIRKLGLERPLLVGHSLGGAISLRVALDHPETISGLALIAPLTHVPPHVPEPFRPLDIDSKLVRRLLAWTVATPIGILRGASVLKQIFHPDPVPADFPIRGGGILGLRPASFCNVSADLVAADADLDSMVERYPTIRMPVAILYGTSDNILDYRFHGESMKARIPQLQLKLVQGAGHMLPVSAPAVTAAFLREAASHDRTNA